MTDAVLKTWGATLKIVQYDKYSNSKKMQKFYNQQLPKTEKYFAQHICETQNGAIQTS
jgi:hypothetical protein